MNKLLYGAAYYHEYMPYDRLDKDVEMLKKAGMNLVRVAESTWSTWEPQEGVFDFSQLERVLDAMEEAGINVIVGTPTYAVPTWMVRKHPEVLAITKDGPGIYGRRQNMDITNPDYRFYSERIIRKLMEVSAHRKCVIGFQVDNETKYYGTSGPNVQAAFVEWIKARFDGDLEAMNAAYGLTYWSNRINSWEDFPNVNGTINGSLGSAFEEFQRSLVTDFLAWQADIVSEYKREDQFITHNFDYAWDGMSVGLHHDINQYHVGKSMDVAGCDIYHPSQAALTGIEIGFGGDIARGIKDGANYLVLETEAQGFPNWTPYPGQLRLQAFSHLANGANCVEYWHWHSIHNAIESYWKGVLSHDLQENAVYREACTIGADFARLSEHLVNLKKDNKVAFLLSHEAHTALDNWFGISATAGDNGNTKYNDVFRWIYDVLFKHNVECDILWPESEKLEDYSMVIVPAMYVMTDEMVERLDAYVEKGGVLVSTFKTAFTNENVQIRYEKQPYGLTECFGISYDQFAFPREDAGLVGTVTGGSKAEVKTFMELITPTTATALASYDHPSWGGYSAITSNFYGEGKAYYLGCMTDEAVLWKVLELALNDAKVEPNSTHTWPIIVRGGTNELGRRVDYYLNYSPEAVAGVTCSGGGVDLLTDETFAPGATFTLPAWGVRIVEGE